MFFQRSIVNEKCCAWEIGALPSTRFLNPMRWVKPYDTCRRSKDGLMLTVGSSGSHSAASGSGVAERRSRGACQRSYGPVGVP